MNRRTLTGAVKRVLVASGVVGRARRRTDGPSVLRILNYHSVSAAADYCKAEIAIHPALFEAHLEFLVRHYQVITLDHAIDCLAAGRPWPERAVCITFDDGYTDNLLAAYPLLRRHGLSATFFVVGDVVLEGRAFWVGWLQQAVARAPSLMRAVKALDAPPELARTGRNAHQPLADWLSLRVNTAPPAARDSMLDDIARALETPSRGEAPSAFMMNLAQVRELAAGGMSIGSHSMSHPILTTLPAEEIVRELRESKRQLEAALQTEVRHFAHPNGLGPLNFSDFTKQTAREVGYRSASTSERGVVQSGDDAYQLRRYSLDDHMVLPAFAFKLEEHRFRALLLER